MLLSLTLVCPVVLSAFVFILAPVVMGVFAKRRKLAGQHVVITGGSKGIGLAMAQQFIKRKCHVTLLARKQADLDDALEQLKKSGPSESNDVKLQAFSADTTDPEQVATAFQKAVESFGPVDLLVCNAGLSIPGRFVDHQLSDFERQFQVNYLGTVNTIKCYLPAMLERRQGHVVIISSALAVIGFAGYSSYAPSKWALRGLADCLRNELQGTGVRVSVGYPPDTDTPGYAQEEALKPDICREVNKAVGSSLFSADKVAASLVGGMERGVYHLPSPDPIQNLLVDSMAGVSPKPAAPLGCLLAPLLYIITAVVRWGADAAARKCNENESAAAGGGEAEAAGGKKRA